MLPPSLLATALESAPDAIVIVDGEGRILFANAQVTALFGYSAEEIATLGIETLLPERFRKAHVAHRHGFANGGRVRAMGADIELFARRKDGSEVPVEVSLSPIREGERTLVAAAIRDVTDRRRIQSELKTARLAAERANQAKSRFLATASHDLRQPLQSLTLLNGTLRRTVHDSVAQEALEHEAQAIESMTRLLNALLDISRLESGAVSAQAVDFSLDALFAEMRNEFTGLAAVKGLELEIAPPGMKAHSDPALVGQVLRNLLSNAIKYTASGRVQMRAVIRDARVRIEVSDTGIGIEADQLALICEEFYQVGSARGSARDGYGLGLSIVSRIIALLGAKLDASSRPGKGSVFAFELPLAAGAAETPSRRTALPEAKPRVRSPRVLLVEDDPGVRDATRMLLGVEGCEVVAAASVAEALERARSQAFDILITDYHLGKSDTGLEVIQGVRGITGSAIGAILVTGDTSSFIRNVPQDGRLRIASKPIQADELLRLMESLLEH